MRKNQKYSKGKMFTFIETWQQSGLSQYKFCKQENLSTSTFGYWLKKYKQEKSKTDNPRNNPGKTFLPVEITTSPQPAACNTVCITITYPNGIQVRCPLSLD